MFVVVSHREHWSERVVLEVGVPGQEVCALCVTCVFVVVLLSVVGLCVCCGNVIKGASRTRSSMCPAACAMSCVLFSVVCVSGGSCLS